MPPAPRSDQRRRRKLHEQRKTVDDEALQKAFALLDPESADHRAQAARRSRRRRSGSTIKPRQHDPNDGVPLEP